MWNYSRELPSNLSENFEKIAEAYMNFEYEVSWFLESDRNKMPLDIAHVMWNPDWNNIHIFNNNRSVQDREIVYSNSLDKYYVIGVLFEEFIVHRLNLRDSTQITTSQQEIVDKI